MKIENIDGGPGMALCLKGYLVICFNSSRGLAMTKSKRYFVTFLIFLTPFCHNSAYIFISNPEMTNCHAITCHFLGPFTYVYTS